MKKIYVLDTNILIDSAGTAIFGFDDNDVVITATTIMELNKHKGDERERGYNVRETSRILRDLRSEQGDLYEGVPINDGGTFRIEKNGYEHELPVWLRNDEYAEADNRILATVLTIMEQNPDKKVALITNDFLMSLDAQALGIETQEYRNDKIESEEMYTGRITLMLDPDEVARLYRDKKIPLSELEGDDSPDFMPNEFVEVNPGTHSSALAWVRGDSLELLPEEIINGTYFGLTARNAGQRFAIAALNAPAEDIPLVIIKGPAGCGKTLLAEAVGLDKTYVGQEFQKGKSRADEEYRNLYITRSNTLPETENLGFLKGDLEEKMGPLLSPFYDNMETLMRIGGETDPQQIQYQVDYMIDDGGPVKIVSLAYIRGRSLDKSVIIVDEAQNITPKQAKTLATRVGEGTKLVLLGDPAQIDSPRLTARSNGLVYAAEKMKDDELCAVITMYEKECVRSELSKRAAKKM